jgi:hypothetical protein
VRTNRPHYEALHADMAEHIVQQDVGPCRCSASRQMPEKILP